MTDRWCRWAIEAVLFVMAAGAPWALGGTLPEAVLALKIGTGLVLVLWAARALATRAVPWKGDVVFWALGGLTLLTALHLIPVPAAALRVLSPNTAETNTFLRPEVGEILPGEDPVPRPSAFPVSLSPPDTRDFFVQLFSLTVLYAAARSNLTGPGPLLRLAWVCAVNGALLCLLGIAQRVSSPPHVIYWTIPTPGTVFGPFVNRNHLPFYANPCLGLACALLALQVKDSAWNVLHRPAALWLVVLIGVTAVGVVFSQSRGGTMAALAAGAGCTLVWFRNARRAGGLGWAVWAAVAVAAIGAWLGWGAVTARVSTLDADRLSDDSRVQMWGEGLGLFSRYPALGTGSGTYAWVEPSARTKPGTEELSAEYAHNEYVEGLVEGGVVRFALTLLLVLGLVLGLVRRHRAAVGRPEGALVLGGLFGVLALAVHSFVDFGLHLPGIAVLAAVYVAAVTAAADRSSPTAVARTPLAAGLAALGLAAAAGLLVWDAWTADRAERNRSAAVVLATGQTPTPEQADRAVRLLTAAAAARPDNALYRHELGQAHLSVALHRPPGSPDWREEVRTALGHWRAARDLSPVMAPPHARLGRYRDLFERADPALVYFERARSLLPTDAGMIFFCGQARWEAGDVPGACADWKASLTNADRHLGDILALARPKLSPAEILRDIMPDRPAVLLKAADLLFPEAEKEAPVRRAYLERARDALAAQPTKTAAEWELEARLEVGLGRPEQAAAAYRRALGLSPRQTAWRMAYVDVLRRLKAYRDARRELETVVAQDPGNRAARDLLAVVERELQLQGKE